MSWLSSTLDKYYNMGIDHSGWLGHKTQDIVGKDYQRHLFNFANTGGMSPAAVFNLDYQQGKANGENPWNVVGQNAGKSAAILAAIFGGAALEGGAGGSGAGGGAAAGGDTGMFGSVTSSGSAPTDYSAGSAGGGWQQYAKAGAGLLGKSGGSGGSQSGQQPQLLQPQRYGQPNAAPQAATANPYMKGLSNADAIRVLLSLNSNQQSPY